MNMYIHLVQYHLCNVRTVDLNFYFVQMIKEVMCLTLYVLIHPRKKITGVWILIMNFTSKEMSPRVVHTTACF